MVAVQTSITDKTDFSTRFLTYATKDLYRTNAFRLLQLSTRATSQEISKRQKTALIASQTGVGIPPGPFSIFQRGVSENKDLAHVVESLHDPVIRLFNELFWIWPDESPLDDQLPNREEDWVRFWHLCESKGQAVAIHNLAVVYHAAALDLESENAEKPLQGKRLELCQLFWAEANKRWIQLHNLDSFWDYLSNRVTEIDDPQLPRVIVRKVREAFPVFLLTIQAQFFSMYVEEKKHGPQDRIYNLMQKTGFKSADVDAALNRVVEPINKRIRSMCRLVESQVESTPQRSPKFIDEQLEQIIDELTVLASIKRGSSGELAGIREEFSYIAQDIINKYFEGTEDWSQALTWLQKVRPHIGQGTTLRKIDGTIQQLQELGQNGRFWRGPGYYQLPQQELNILETARQNVEDGSFETAIGSLLTRWQIQPADNSKISICINYALSRALHQRAMFRYSEGAKILEEKSSILIQIENRLSSLINSSQGNYYFKEWTGQTYPYQLTCFACGTRIYGGYYKFDVYDNEVPVCEACRSRHVAHHSQQQIRINAVFKQIFEDLYRANDVNPKAVYLVEAIEEAKVTARKLNISIPARPAPLKPTPPARKPETKLPAKPVESTQATQVPAAAKQKTEPQKRPATSVAQQTTKTATPLPVNTSAKPPTNSNPPPRRSSPSNNQQSNRQRNQIVFIILIFFSCVALLVVDYLRGITIDLGASQKPARVITVIVSPTPEIIVIPRNSASQSSPPITPTSNPKTYEGCVLNNLNVRSGPGTDRAVMAVIPHGDCVQVIGRNADCSWLYVELMFNSKQIDGWVSTSFMDVQLKQGESLFDLNNIKE